jgi:arabinofuranosyltransferase
VDNRRIERIGPWVLLALAAKLGMAFGACTQDDAFISFRYAENLVAGHGLVFNPGEWVEGISNLSWTLLIAGGMASGIDPVAFTIVLGLVSVAALMLLLGMGARAMGMVGLATLLPAAFILADPLFLLEAVEGLETAFYAAVILAGTLGAIDEARTGRRHVRSSLWFALAVWTRPEAPLLIGAVHLGLLLCPKDDARAQLNRSMVGAIPVIAAVIALELFRFTTYGEWLPNTYYAKTGAGLAAIPRGLEYVAQHMIDHALLWGLVGAHFVFGIRSRAAWAMGLPILLHTAYVISVGGDFKPTGRFFAPVLPMMALLGAAGFVHLVTRTASSVRIGTMIGAAAWMVWMTPQQMDRAKAQAAERHANLQARRAVGEWLSSHVPPSTVLAIHSAGVIPYYAGLPTIDMWGLSDKHIARTIPANMGRGMAGHEKTDPAYVFAQKPPLFLPEDKVFVLKRWRLVPNPDFPESFAEAYRLAHVQIGGGWLNFWVRKDWDVPWERR